MKNEFFPERRIEMLHFQMTEKCNLNCWFCGQRKEKSKGKLNDKMKLEDWMRVIDDVKQHSSDSKLPSVMIWGGEAELSASFVPVLEKLGQEGFSIGMVSNGTLLDQYKDVILNNLDCLYLSLDGNEKLHDLVRGDGVFKKVEENIKLLKKRISLIIMTVLTEDVVENLEEVLESFVPFEPELVILQDMIIMEREEAEEYFQWCKSKFGKEAKGIFNWVGDEGCTVQRIERSQEVQKKLDTLGEFPFDISYLPHIEAREPYCMSPFRHVHIGASGLVSFCTDFMDVTIGDVHERSIYEMFESLEAEKWRMEIINGKCLTCSHCSWRYKKDFYNL